MTESSAFVAPEPRGGRWLRLVFLALLAGGLVLFARYRSPKDVQLDVTIPHAADVVEVDLVVLRDGKPLARIDEHYGPAGAPDVVHAQLRAAPGAANVEVTLVRRDHSAQRDRAEVTLAEGAPARFEPR